MIHFVLVLVYGLHHMVWGLDPSSFCFFVFFLHVRNKLLRTSYWKGYSLSTALPLHPCFKKVSCSWISLMVQWIRIHLAMQGTLVQFLVWEDSTCCTQLSPCTRTTEPSSCNYWIHVLQLQKLSSPRALLKRSHHKRSHHNEKSLCTATRE